MVGLSLSQYDQETSSFKQAALYRSPQDGLSQILAVVESGVYAVGIHTLTSTESMFLDGGVGRSTQSALGGKLLAESCLKLSYSYLVASTLRGDSRTLEGGALGLLSLLSGGGLAEMAAQQALDSRMLDELGDPLLLESCPHDDLPASLPETESGFDRTFSLLVQEKPADHLALVVERESLLRVQVHTSNTKNEVGVYLLEHFDASEAHAWTVGSGASASFIHLVKPQKRAYTLKIVYETLDQDDPCPSFDLRVILKPVGDAVSENLHCSGKELPPASIPVATDDFSFSSEYSFGSHFISKVTEQGGALEYDVLIKWPGADPESQYYLDVESKSDVLTGQMTFTLLYEAPGGHLELLGRSHPVGSSATGSRYTQRLKLLDREGDLADDPNLTGAVLRVRFPPSSIHLLETLSSGGHLEGREACHTFQLSIRAELRGGENENGGEIGGPSRLMRVRWEGQEVADGVYDPASRVYAALEFDRSMKAAFQLLKSSDWVALQADKPHADGQLAVSRPGRVTPTAKRLSPSDPSTVLLQFRGGSLARGWCHKLELSGGGPGPDFDEKLLASDLEICASNCLCSWKGTSSCHEDTGKCTCKFPYAGEDCSQCEVGHSLDPDSGECVLGSTCAALGGLEDCSGHGVCEQRGQHAICQCSPGFVNDGLAQCAKCADPLFVYPDCQLRSWILEEPDINCKDLEYKMPTYLWKETTGVEHGDSQVLQGPDGVVNWAQRYRLVEGGSQRSRSSHQFLVPSTAVFRLFVDTSSSGALVKYRLLDEKSAELLSSAGPGQDADADGFVSSSAEVTLLHQPDEKDTPDAPFVLLLEYKYERPTTHGHHREEPCPTVDIHLVVEPLQTAREALRCSDSELTEAAAPRASGW